MSNTPNTNEPAMTDRMTDLVHKLVGALEHCEGVFMSHEINHINGGKIEDDALAIIRAALSEAKAGGWLPIEQASDEDKLRCWVLVGEAVHFAAYIVISFEEKRDLDGRYIDQVDHDEYWMDIDSGDPLEPTHFQPLTRPLPAPPAQKEPT